MYIPHHYKNENTAEVKAFIKDNAFGILINQYDGRPWATHIPLELERNQEGQEVLTGHIAKANPQWKAFQDQSEVLCIFNGPHTYVSSSWYQEEEVPTWDYIAVHVYGTIKILDESDTMRALERLVSRYEKDMDKPIQLRELSPKTLRQVKGVVGFEIRISEIKAAYKLSQTRPEDHAAIVSELKKRDDPGARAISKIISKE
ncbi:FMN-binding negative transcriptional regulator [Flagellimonas sp. DF-77]|uniref:FMN-binding negative transcriptional regulator n=1 Tax=Flagellimonas algarum TaxID=3230298 RepID=UPI003397C0B5